MLLANAPVSLGIYGLDDSVRLPGRTVATQIAELGYDGIDSGPIGLFGSEAQTVSMLRDARLQVSGGWIDLPFSKPDAFAARLGELERALDFFEAMQEAGLGPVRPTLADSGSRERTANPGSGHPQLDSDEWRDFSATLAIAAERARRRGLVPTFHHHIGTYVESVEEIERFLSVGDVDLTLDTGHLILAGGDPCEALSRWSGRINHVHLKDVAPGVFEKSTRNGHDMQQAWRDGPFAPLGRGILDLDGFMDQLVATGYDGWVVVEQDIVVQENADLERAIVDQRDNRHALEPWFPR